MIYRLQMNIEETLQMHANLSVGHFHICLFWLFEKSSVNLINKVA